MESDDKRYGADKWGNDPEPYEYDASNQNTPSPETKTPQKKRIAFIDKIINECDAEPDSIMDRKRVEYNNTLISKLGEIGEVKTYCRLDNFTYNHLMGDSGSDGFYDVIITHVPFVIRGFDRTQRLDYTESTSILRTIKEANPDALLIAYTGAGTRSLPDAVLHSMGISHVLRRPSIYQEGELEQAIEQITRWIKDE